MRASTAENPGVRVSVVGVPASEQQRWHGEALLIPGMKIGYHARSGGALARTRSGRPLPNIAEDLTGPVRT